MSPKSHAVRRPRGAAGRCRVARYGLFSALLLLLGSASHGAESPSVTRFHREVEPLLSRYCHACHGEGEKSGNIAFDQLLTDDARLNPVLWSQVLINVRTGLMPPAKKPHPSPEEIARMADWIKYGVFQIDPADPDPGRVTVHRLNRTEYRNTIRDLMAVDFDTDIEFPPDDTGHGFDNNGRVLTVSPLLLEQYLAAGRTIVSQAVPAVAEAGSGKWFPEPVPESTAERRSYAGELLRTFAARAFRRPPDEETIGRLVALAEDTYTQPGQRFENGIAQAMSATLASSRFLFREEAADPGTSAGAHPFIDDYSLASRLSYFLWSSMPDDELFRLAQGRMLRPNLRSQVARMLADRRSEAFVRNFTGQWLQTRNLETIAIDAPAVLAHDEGPNPELLHLRDRLKELIAKPEAGRTAADRAELATSRERFLQIAKSPHLDFDAGLRRAMRDEVERFFSGIVHEDRSVLELVESDYSYLNERLARHYGLTQLQVTGPELRRVTLPADSPRGGVLTMGGTLLVTSNPSRTSPVKRGRFILENILGYPTPLPPPNIPPLEDAANGLKKKDPTLREMLAVHRQDPKCSSCHDRMDPLGLALENFNALGQWREHDNAAPIDANGRLITGEPFHNVRELKRLLVTNHRLSFYRTLTEKLLIYALGRGLDYSDTETVDRIVDRLEREHGRFSTLLLGVIESVPFQKCRAAATLAGAGTPEAPPRSGETKPSP